MEKHDPMQASAVVFNIQSYCIHDGPGIRSTVFVKGCPLRCIWCANPESQSARPQLMTYEQKCTGCGKCAAACPRGAITLERRGGGAVAVTNRDICTDCGACVSGCLAKTREIAGHLMTAEAALETVKRDTIFYNASGGGMTLSGGEPLAHPDFAESLLTGAQAAGIHTAIESSCYAERAVIDRVFPHVDLALLDIKHMDSAVHRRLTGVPNGRILANIRHIHDDLRRSLILRIPTIPGCNDSPENMAAIGAFAASPGADVSVHLLPYHMLGDSKSESLGHVRSLGITPPSGAHMHALREIVAQYGVQVTVVG